MFFRYLAILAALLASSKTWDSPFEKTRIDGANWMRDNIEILGERKLKEICIPGSHDSGMSNFFSGTPMAHPCNVLTQSRPIKGQLENGVRYFDVRPDIVKKNHYRTGHYLKLPGETCIGGNGQSMESIVNDINNFIESHNELIIVKLSHSLNSDRCGFFNKEEWKNVFKILDQTRNFYVHEDGNVHLEQLTLNHFTKNGTKGAVMYIVDKSEINLEHRLGRGFFYESNLNLYDEYSNTSFLSLMMNDQIKKMAEESEKKYFILSWTLTQSAKDAALCRMKMAKSIRELAVLAHDNLPKVIAKVNSTSFPNVLYLDDIKSLDVVSVAMEINNKRFRFPRASSNSSIGQA